MTTLPLVAGTIVETAVCFPSLNTYGVSVPVYAAGELTHGLRVPDPPPWYSTALLVIKELTSEPSTGPGPPSPPHPPPFTPAHEIHWFPPS